MNCRLADNADFEDRVLWGVATQHLRWDQILRCHLDLDDEGPGEFESARRRLEADGSITLVDERRYAEIQKHFADGEFNGPFHPVHEPGCYELTLHGADRFRSLQAEHRGWERHEFAFTVDYGRLKTTPGVLERGFGSLTVRGRVVMIGTSEGACRPYIERRWNRSFQAFVGVGERRTHARFEYGHDADGRTTDAGIWKDFWWRSPTLCVSLEESCWLKLTELTEPG